MADRTAASTVVDYYDRHPINEQQILNKLTADGVALDGLSEDVLQNYDQDHFGGIGAVDVLAEKAGIAAGHYVLDVCSGVGGPARYLAHNHGCHVTGLELTESRFEAAGRLTSMVGLAHLVDFRLGNALDMPFDDAAFDVVIGQEAWLHVPDKPRLIGECVRVVKPGGVIAFTDIVQNQPLEPAALARVQHAVAAADFGSLDGYAHLLREAGCVVREQEDLTEPWAEILVGRLEMYRSLKEQTIESFGVERFREWDEGYSFFVANVVAGRMGGVRIVAQRP